MPNNQNKSLVSGFIALVIFLFVAIFLIIIGFLTPWMPKI